MPADAASSAGAGSGAAPHRKAHTRARILDAAARLFAERGYERTSVARIAKRAAVSPSGVLWHFGDKAALFEATVERVLEPFREAFEASARHLDPEKRLSETLGAFDRFVLERRDTVTVLLRWMAEMPDFRDKLHRALLALHSRFEADVRDALAEVLPAGVDPAPLASGLLALLDGNLVLLLLEPERAEARRAGLRAVLDRIPRRGG